MFKLEVNFFYYVVFGVFSPASSLKLVYEHNFMFTTMYKDPKIVEILKWRN